MIVPDSIKYCLGAAAEFNLPFAIWRRPGQSGIQAIVACQSIETRQVFSASSEQAFFALNGFDAISPNTVDAIVADLLVVDSEIQYFDGNKYTATPSSSVQKKIATAIDSRSFGAKIQAGTGAGIPTQMDQTDYQALVAKAVDTIRKGGFQKVVTSRSEARKLPDDYDLLALFERLADKLESAFVTLIFLPGEGAWLVGTPETLLSTEGNTVSTVALAGTQWLEDTSDLRSVGWPDKLIEEQAIVSSDIRKVLESVGIRDFQEQGPRTVKAANLVHLQSKFVANLQSDFDQKLEALLIALHPTSAVCGMPKKAALDFIRKNESYDRSYYTGFIGPVNFKGGTDLYVNLRTAQIIGNTAFQYVGGGIVENSVPLVEWQETVEKTKSIGSIL